MNSPELVSKVIDLAEDAIMVVDHELRIVLFNQGAERIFGYCSTEMVGQPMEKLMPGRFAATHRRHVEDFAAGPIPSRSMGERNRILGRRKDGTEFPAEASISRADGERGMTFMVILRDISQRVEIDERLRASLREKEALVREIHHRVKNNLQVVYSLLGLQARAQGDERLRRLFEESQSRIHSMSLLHEMLYQSMDLAQIDFAEYVQQLTFYLFRSFGVPAERISLVTRLDKVYLNLDTAVPCGLVLNELVSNSLKYAFPEQSDGEIRVELHQPSPGTVELIVADNGIGLSDDWGQGKSLGLRLVRTLAEQLAAELEVKSEAGTEVRLMFPIPLECRAE